MNSEQIVSTTAGIVSAFVSNNTVAASDLAGIIGQVHSAVKAAAAGDPAPVAEPELQPAVPIRSSVKHDFIVCLEDGKKLKMLKRHLMSHYNMTPEQYRARWGLPANYPMTAPAYTEKRRQLAVQIGLGHKKAA